MKFITTSRKDDINIAIIFAAPKPDDLASVALPSDSSVADYYTAWVRNNLHEACGFIDGVRVANCAPPMTPVEREQVLVEFETALAALPSAAAEPALRAFRNYVSFLQPTGT